MLLGHSWNSCQQLQRHTVSRVALSTISRLVGSYNTSIAAIGKTISHHNRVAWSSRIITKNPPVLSLRATRTNILPISELKDTANERTTKLLRDPMLCALKFEKREPYNQVVRKPLPPARPTHRPPDKKTHTQRRGCVGSHLLHHDHEYHTHVCAYIKWRLLHGYARLIEKLDTPLLYQVH